LEKRNVKFHYNSEIIRVQTKNDKIEYVEDSNGKKYYSDIFISNHDAADFRGRFLNRKKFSEQKLDKMQWTLAPFTMYLGIKGKINNLELHNYFLGNNFRGYADKIFVSSIAPQKPYYYVNAIARIDPFAAPAGCENIFILMPAPTLIYKPDYSDKEIIAKNLIEDLSKRLDLDLENKIIYKKILAPDDWAKKTKSLQRVWFRLIAWHFSGWRF
jgi:phytoene desaturase